MEHVTVYRQPGRYAGWPANYGIWSWGDEIVVGFTVGYHSGAGGFHTRDKGRPFEVLRAHSPDGGHTWRVAPLNAPAPGGRAFSADEHMVPELQVARAIESGDTPTECPGGIDFSHPDLALLCARTGLHAGARSWFYVSYDRCCNWLGPYWIPTFGLPGIAARTDYVVSSPSTCTFFLTAAKANGREARPFCMRTVDGGKSFRLLSWIGPEPGGFAIMPASLRLPSGRLLTSVRCHEGTLQDANERNWIDLYVSVDDGMTWSHLARPVMHTGQGGNPPTLTRLHDGRLCITYGYRDAPYGIRATFSDDDGATWGHETILRSDGGTHDLGYPRTVQRSDGTMVTVYYFNDHPAGERHIVATLWQP